MGDGVPLLGVDEVGEHQGVADEEDGGVVANNVPVALLCVELHCKPARVPGAGQSFYQFVCNIEFRSFFVFDALVDGEGDLAKHQFFGET